MEFGLGLAGAIWSLVSIVFAIIVSVFAFGVSNSLVSDS